MKKIILTLGLALSFAKGFADVDYTQNYRLIHEAQKLANQSSWSQFGGSQFSTGVQVKLVKSAGESLIVSSDQFESVDCQRAMRIWLFVNQSRADLNSLKNRHLILAMQKLGEHDQTINKLFWIAIVSAIGAIAANVLM